MLVGIPPAPIYGQILSVKSQLLFYIRSWRLLVLCAHDTISYLVKTTHRVSLRIIFDSEENRLHKMVECVIQKLDSNTFFNRVGCSISTHYQDPVRR